MNQKDVASAVQQTAQQLGALELAKFESGAITREQYVENIHKIAQHCASIYVAMVHPATYARCRKHR
jgi:hypothetical protein